MQQPALFNAHCFLLHYASQCNVPPALPLEVRGASSVRTSPEDTISAIAALTFL